MQTFSSSQYFGQKFQTCIPGHSGFFSKELCLKAYGSYLSQKPGGLWRIGTQERELIILLSTSMLSALQIFKYKLQTNYIQTADKLQTNCRQNTYKLNMIYRQIKLQTKCRQNTGKLFYNDLQIWPALPANLLTLRV